MSLPCSGGRQFMMGMTIAHTREMFVLTPWYRWKYMFDYFSHNDNVPKPDG